MPISSTRGLTSTVGKYLSFQIRSIMLTWAPVSSKAVTVRPLRLHWAKAFFPINLTIVSFFVPGVDLPAGLHFIESGLITEMESSGLWDIGDSVTGRPLAVAVSLQPLLPETSSSLVPLFAAEKTMSTVLLSSFDTSGATPEFCSTLWVVISYKTLTGVFRLWPHIWLTHGIYHIGKCISASSKLYYRIVLNFLTRCLFISPSGLISNWAELALLCLGRVIGPNLRAHSFLSYFSLLLHLWYCGQPEEVWAHSWHLCTCAPGPDIQYGGTHLGSWLCYTSTLY